jgi:hypothetical protein
VTVLSQNGRRRRHHCRISRMLRSSRPGSAPPAGAPPAGAPRQCAPGRCAPGSAPPAVSDFTTSCTGVSRHRLHLSGGARCPWPELSLPRYGWDTGPSARSGVTMGSPAGGCTSWCAAMTPKARRPSSPDHADLITARMRCRSRSRTRSCGCANSCSSRAWMPARKPSRAPGPHARVVAGGLHDLADPVPAGVHHPPAAETATLDLDPVLRRDAQRTVAGRHHPLGDGRRS